MRTTLEERWRVVMCFVIVVLSEVDFLASEEGDLTIK